MQKSQRLGVTVFALSILAVFHGPLSANGQSSQKAHPLFDVAGKGSKSIQGYTPAQIKRGYGFDKIGNQGEGQTIAIVDAFHDANIGVDFAFFNNYFGLPCATKESVNNCLTIVPTTGTSDSVTLSVWAFETALDVEWAHAIAPKAKILLVEANSDQLSDLLAAVDVAVGSSPQPSVVSMSWGIPEANVHTEITDDGHFVASHVTFFASAGDFGHGAFYPAASPFVMGVGGTTLHLDSAGNYQSEKAWSFDASTGFGGGGGQSVLEKEPLFQSSYPIPNDPNHLRGTPDVAYVANPNTGIAIYDTVPYFGDSGWFETGGTSVGPPQWAALVAIANSLRGPKKPSWLTGSLGLLYDVADDDNFTDITKGRNGSCSAQCKAKPGYDYVTGLGTPQADNLIPDLKDLK